MPYNFIVSTTKGPLGSITTLDESNLVGDLYSEAQKIINWTPEENDFYIIILSGKKLLDETALLSTLKPNPTRAQIVITKLSKPSKRITKESIAAAEATKNASIDTSMKDEEEKQVDQAPKSTPPSSPQPDKKTAVSAPAETNTTVTTTTSSSESTAIATKEDQPKTMVDGDEEVTKTTTTTPSTTTTATTTVPTASPDSKSDFTSEPFDYSQTPKLNFIPLLSSEKNMARFWEILDALNPELAAQLNKDTKRFTQFMEITTRNEKTPGFDPKVYTEEAEKALKGQVAPSAGPTPEERAARAKAIQQQREQAQKKLESEFTDADNENLTNLMALGFSRAKCVQAYLICDKNPDLAANWLFSQME